MSRKWRNWCQNEVDEETKGADSRDKVKHNERSDQLFLERMMKVAKKVMYVCMRAFVTCRSYSLSSHECATVGQTEKLSLACYRKVSVSMLDHEVTVAESSTVLEHKQQSCVVQNW